ncbi:MAG: DUF4129 domain-containing protein [Pseudomonadota bacterium]
MRAVLLIVVILASASTGVFAQLSQDDILVPGERNEAVTDAVWLDRIEDDVIYLSPDAPFQPDASIEVKVPDPEPTQQEQRSANRWTTGLIFGAFLLAVIVVFALFGGSMQVSFRRQNDGSVSSNAGMTDADELSSLPIDGFLERIAAMADRREALILLVSRALERAAQLNGLTLGRAQTARDVMRVIPRTWSHREALNGLVREVERVHFGGRDLSEEGWQDCFGAARPIFQAGARP